MIHGAKGELIVTRRSVLPIECMGTANESVGVIPQIDGTEFRPVDELRKSFVFGKPVSNVEFQGWLDKFERTVFGLFQMPYATLISQLPTSTQRLLPAEISSRRQPVTA